MLYINPEDWLKANGTLVQPNDVIWDNLPADGTGPTELFVCLVAHNSAYSASMLAFSKDELGALLAFSKDEFGAFTHALGGRRKLWYRVPVAKLYEVFPQGW